MTDQERLSLGVEQTQPTVDVYGKLFVRRVHTRSVEKRLHEATREMRKIAADENSEGDAYIEVLAEIVDAMLAPEGGHRTPAKRIVIDKWNADALGVDELKAFVEALQEQSAEDRPT